MKRLLLAFAIVVILSAPAYAKLNIVATLPWIGSLAHVLGGDQVSVKILVKPNQDPHQIEAKPSMILAARSADILLYNGLDLEAGYLPILIESSRNPRIQPGRPGNLDCSQFIRAIEKLETTDRSMGDVHPLGNPHYHLSARNIALVARGLTRMLERLDPGQASFYQANLASFEARLIDKQKQWVQSHLKGKKYIAYHKYFEYLALEFDFQIIGYIEEKPGIGASAGHVGKLIESMKRSHPDGILTTSYQNAREVASLSQKTGIRRVVVPHDVGCVPEAYDWMSLMDSILKTLR